MTHHTQTNITGTSPTHLVRLQAAVGAQVCKRTLIQDQYIAQLVAFCCAPHGPSKGWQQLQQPTWHMSTLPCAVMSRSATPKSDTSCLNPMLWRVNRVQVELKASRTSTPKLDKICTSARTPVPGHRSCWKAANCWPTARQGMQAWACNATRMPL